MYCHTTECCKLQVPSKTGTSPSPPPLPPRTGCVWGDNWRVPWHAAREGALGALTATQKLRSLTSVCTSTQQAGGGRARVYVCVRPRVLMHVFIRGGGWLFLSFARHNPFLLSLREHPGVMRDEPERGWRQFWGRPALLVFLFFPLSWCSSLLPLLHLFLWNSPVLL